MIFFFFSLEILWAHNAHKIKFFLCSFILNAAVYFSSVCLYNSIVWPPTAASRDILLNYFEKNLVLYLKISLFFIFRYWHRWHWAIGSQEMRSRIFCLWLFERWRNWKTTQWICGKTEHFSESDTIVGKSFVART